MDDPLRVMTFNILHDSVRNLAAPWERRRPSVVETIRSGRPDVVCLQEVSPRQLEDLARDLEEYEFVPGVPSGATKLIPWLPGLYSIGRLFLGDFFDRGELCPILVRRGRVEVLGHGCVFSPPRHDGSGRAPILSPTPHVVSWARVRVGSGAACAVYNTHRGVTPWTGNRTAGELLAIPDRDWREEPQILVGDFNCLPSWPLVRTLTAERNGGPPPLRDAWRDADARTGPRGTFHWGFGLPGPRLDYILVRPRCAVRSVETLGARIGGVFPSDHFALAAEMELRTSRP